MAIHAGAVSPVAVGRHAPTKSTYQLMLSATASMISVMPRPGRKPMERRTPGHITRRFECAPTACGASPDQLMG